MRKIAFASCKWLYDQSVAVHAYSVQGVEPLIPLSARPKEDFPKA